MGIRHNSLQLGLAILAGFAGGTLANRSWVSEPALAKPAAAQVVTASAIQIVDEAGRPRMQVGLVGGEKTPGVIFLDAQSGEPVGGLGLEADQSGVLLLRGPGGKTVVQLRAGDGDASLKLTAADEEARLNLRAKDTGDAELVVENRERKQEVRLELDKERASVVALQEGEKGAVGFLVGPAVDPALIVLKDNLPRAVLGSTDVLLKGPEKLQFKERRGPASLVLIDEQGRARWQVP